MVSLILCVAIFGTTIGLMLHELSDGCVGPFGAFLGVLLGVAIWILSTNIMIQNASTELVDSTSYKIEAINGHYWETINGNKRICYIDEGKELQSYNATKKQIEYSTTITEPVLIIENREITNGFVRFWLWGFDNETRVEKHRVVMPRHIIDE